MWARTPRLSRIRRGVLRSLARGRGSGRGFDADRGRCALAVGSLQVWLELLHQLRLGHEADDALDHLTVLEQDHGRDARDTEVRGRMLVLVDIQLDDLELTGLFDRDLL